MLGQIFAGCEIRLRYLPPLLGIVAANSGG
jgi:hypothetical protein